MSFMTDALVAAGLPAARPIPSTVCDSLVVRTTVNCQSCGQDIPAGGVMQGHVLCLRCVHRRIRSARIVRIA